MRSDDPGRAMYELVRELYPLPRSITGNGVRETLGVLAAHLPEPLAVSEVPSGTSVLDWTVPDEWNVREAWIAAPDGTRVVDFQRSNLHLVGYSTPVRMRIPLPELKAHLHTLPDQPDWIPYRTSYYQKTWGFCLTQRQLNALPDGMYEVCIDTTLAPGHLTYGELVLPGESPDEVLLSSHVCHPSLANDNLSAMVVSVALAQRLGARSRRRYTYRFLYAPGTIGAIAWLARNRPTVHRIRHGLTLVCLGDASPFTYKRTLRGDAEIDRAARLALRDLGSAHQLIDFFPYGYDERQYHSPWFRLPVGSLMRGRHGHFPEYHTSADNLDFVSPERLAQSLTVLETVVAVLEGNRAYRNLVPDAEPQLGRRGLYRATGGSDVPSLELALLWVLNLSDGQHTLLDIAERAGLPFSSVRAAADRLLSAALLAEA